MLILSSTLRRNTAKDAEQFVHDPVRVVVKRNPAAERDNSRRRKDANKDKREDGSGKKELNKHDDEKKEVRVCLAVAVHL